MKKPFFARYAFWVLVIVFFFVPFAMRGARYAVQRMKNDVKDWLPADFPETAELDWFRKHFLGEQFVVISWEDCHGTDERFRKFVDGLFPELPPSQRKRGQEQEDLVDPQFGYSRSYAPANVNEPNEFVGNQLNLFAGEDPFLNWGGQNEKWIRSGKSDWVYITPKGELYQWQANRSWPAQGFRALSKSFSGQQKLQGKLITEFPAGDGRWYYEDPTRLNARLVKTVKTGPSIISSLLSEDSQLDLTTKKAHDRLRGVLYGDDDTQTCILVTLTDAAKEDPRALVGRGILGKPRGLLLKVAEEAGVQPPIPPPAVPGFLVGLFGGSEPVAEGPMLRLGGPPVDNAAIDEEGQITLVRLLGLSLAVGLGLSWLCFRSIAITLMVFLVGGISAITSVGVVFWTGSQLDAVLMSMPSLVYVLGISGAVHVVNYYRESVAESGMSSAPDRAVKLGLWPCTMAAFTTSLGLVSLGTSNIVPIKKFGLYAAVGVIATLILLFTYLPAALEMFPPRRYAKRKTEEAGASESPIEKALDQFWQMVGHWVMKHYRFAAVVSMLVLCLGIYGTTRINTSIQLLKLFDPQAKIIEDYEWLESNLGKLVPMEIVIRVHPELEKSLLGGEEVVDADDEGKEARGEEANVEVADVSDELDLKLNFQERMSISDSVADALRNVEAWKDDLSNPMLASTFAPDGSGGGMIRRLANSHVAKRLEQSKQQLMKEDFLAYDQDDQHELWRISLRLAALNDIDFGEFVDKVKCVVEPIMYAYECRENFLNDLPVEESREGMRVFFFGYAGKDASSEAAKQRALETGYEALAIDQTSTFILSLIDLLKKEGVQDNDKYHLFATKADLASITPADTVVLLADTEGVTLEALEKTGALRLDARNHRFDPRFDRTACQSERKISAIYTGLVPIVYKAQRTLLTSLIQSTALAFGMIAIVMILLLRSPRAGLISMLPNIFPVVCVIRIHGAERPVGRYRQHDDRERGNGRGCG